jgi:threonine dehydrogenase-like Zn-dependent dehydrogenase
MQGLVFNGNREVGLQAFPDPRPGPGEVVVAMRASGICGSDLNLYARSVSIGR